MGSNELLFFVGFLVLIFTLLFIDLGVFSKKSHVIGFKEAIIWTSVWVSFAVGFYFFLSFAGEMIHGVDTPDELRLKLREYDHAFLMSRDWETDLSTYRRNLALEF